MASTTSSGELKKGRLGVLGIVFFVVAASAPLVGMTGAVPVAMLVGTGSAVPGTYLAVGLTLLLFSVGYSAMSSRVTNTGAFFAYVGRGLGTNMGVASAFTSILAYATIQLAIYGFFGGLVQGTLEYFYWWPGTGAPFAVVFIATATASGAILGAGLTVLLVRSLAKTGILATFGR
jgi:amino acid transporter